MNAVLCLASLQEELGRQFDMDYRTRCRAFMLELEARKRSCLMSVDDDR
jgi:hypothetical protein